MKKQQIMAWVIGGFLILSLGTSLRAQPIVDSVRSLQKQNDRTYKMLDQLDGYGDSYAFTNVIKWKITDADLQNQIRDALAKEPFNLKKEEFDVSEYYLFCAPAGPDKVEPFHILVRGYPKEKKVGKKKAGISIFGDEVSDNAGVLVPKAFQGKRVIQFFHRTPGMLETVNTTQGENVEIPGEIVPHGSQLVKDVKMRYVFNKMFSQFYSKKAILDEQRAYYGLPTSDADYIPPATNDQDSIARPLDPEATQELPDATLSAYRATRYDKLIDVSINHLQVNVTKNVGLELEMGHSEVGLPFWSAGESRFWINLKNQIGAESNVKLGLVFPLDFGDKDALIFNARQLSGGFGGSLDAYFAGIDFFSAFNLPMAVKLSIMPGGGSNSSIIKNGEPIVLHRVDGTDTTLAKGATFYRTALIAQVYIPTIVQLDLNNFIQVSAGVGILNVEQSIIPTTKMTQAQYTNGHPWFTADKVDKIQDIARVSATVSPHFMVEYVNHKNSKFGLSAGYDHEFMFGGWIELIQDHLRLELGYSAPLIRDVKAWEPGSFFSITPRFYF